MRKTTVALLTWVVILIAAFPAASQSGTGWTAQYFDNPNLQGTPVYTESAPYGINFNWGLGSPNPAVPTDQFSARFSSVQEFEQGTYEFVAHTDDGLRLFIDNVIVIDQFIGRPLTTDRVQVALTEGSHSIVLEYMETIDNAVVQLQWFQVGTTPAFEIPRAPTEPYLLDRLGERTGDVITGAGGSNIGGEDLTGNAYASIIVQDGVFKRNVGEIGLSELLNQNIVQAIDVFGLFPEGDSFLTFNTPATVCMRGTGDLVFLSAAQTPRVPIVLEPLENDDEESEYICGQISEAGLLLLIDPPESESTNPDSAGA